MPERRCNTISYRLAKVKDPYAVNKMHRGLQRSNSEKKFNVINIEMREWHQKYHEADHWYQDGSQFIKLKTHGNYSHG